MTFAIFDDMVMPHASLDPDEGLSLICQLQELMQSVGSYLTCYLIKLQALSSLDCWPQSSLSTNDGAILKILCYHTWSNFICAMMPGPLASVKGFSRGCRGKMLLLPP